MLLPLWPPMVGREEAVCHRGHQAWEDTLIAIQRSNHLEATYKEVVRLSTILTSCSSSLLAEHKLKPGGKIVLRWSPACQYRNGKREILQRQKKGILSAHLCNTSENSFCTGPSNFCNKILQVYIHQNHFFQNHFKFYFFS